MRIAIDCRFAGEVAGLGRYTRELVAALLRRRDPVSYVLLVRSAAEPWIADLPHPPETVTVPAPHYSFREHILLPLILRSIRPDLLFAPHFNVPLFCPVPFVVTVHDLILHRYPNRASWLRQAAYRLLLRRAVFRARRIIAVSAFTALELGNVFGPRILSNTTVIPEGVSREFSPATAGQIARVRRKYGLTSPFFLYVGNAKEHKNLPMLLEAFRRHEGDQELVLVTGGREADVLHVPERTVLLRRVPDADLPALLTAAECFVSPSLYEGFGLPMLEALACGCPVIAVNRTAMPEVLRDRALLIEPSVEALRHALAHPPRRPVLVPEEFRWDVTAERTMAVLQAT